MKYTLERVTNVVFQGWVIYADDGDFERSVFASRDIDKALEALRELREETELEGAE